MSGASEFAGKLFAGPCEFMLGVAGLEQLPPEDKPEVALAGRSNVGKSSLVNALTGRKTLAKTSNTPGRTQQLNFFNLGDALYLVDMPGYGYAKVARAEKKKWDRLIRDYLRSRANLRCVFILIDARHGVKESDEEILSMLDEAGVSARIVLTKADKVKDEELLAVLDDMKAVLKKHVAAFPEVIVTSTVEKTGIDELRAVIASFLLA